MKNISSIVSNTLSSSVILNEFRRNKVKSRFLDSARSGIHKAENRVRALAISVTRRCKQILRFAQNDIYFGFLFSSLFLIGCGAAEIRPVDLFPEDECANCRMSVSDPAFASEIISQEDEVFKFDDLACLEKFRKKRNEVKIAAIFVKDYENKQWLRYETSVVIQTGIETPMGSGRIAVASNERAKALTGQFPVKDISEKMGKSCCTDEECKE